MAILVSLTPDGVGVVYTSSGLLTGQDLIDADDRFGAELERNPALRYLLVDHSAIPDEDVDTKSLRLLADRTGHKLTVMPEGLVAIVAPNDVLFGLSRMWAGMSGGPRLIIEVTRERDAAIKWLEQKLGERGLPFELT
jgi:hypothetical protein